MSIEALPLPATVNGLPFHPLIVHAVVVILPLTVLGAIGISVWPAMRRHLGLLVLLFGVISLVLVPIATNSGEQFRDRLGPFIAKRIHQHQLYAGNLLPWTAVLLALLLLTMIVDIARRLGPVTATPAVVEAIPDPAIGSGETSGGVGLATRAPAEAAAPAVTRLDRWFGKAIPASLRAKPVLLRRIQPVLSVLTIAAALVLVYFVYKTGDSGAKVVWGSTA
jgi:hypothetical protein